ncbi:hypothetical protein [Agromyces sp. H66]|uniref:hypothetical protein n=1 Tax=Agromyces sp. H66 TaxID=2529859 RepID=UPI0010A9D278|nr:hypothetical protein [Agromyces sp. H66]
MRVPFGGREGASLAVLDDPLACDRPHELPALGVELAQRRRLDARPRDAEAAALEPALHRLVEIRDEGGSRRRHVDRLPLCSTPCAPAVDELVDVRRDTGDAPELDRRVDAVHGRGLRGGRRGARHDDGRAAGDLDARARGRVRDVGRVDVEGSGGRLRLLRRGRRGLGGRRLRRLLGGRLRRLLGLLLGRLPGGRGRRRRLALHADDPGRRGAVRHGTRRDELGDGTVAGDPLHVGERHRGAPASRVVPDRRRRRIRRSAPPDAPPGVVGFLITDPAMPHPHAVGATMVGPTALLSATLSGAQLPGCGVGPIGHGIVRGPARRAHGAESPIVAARTRQPARTRPEGGQPL